MYALHCACAEKIFDLSSVKLKHQQFLSEKKQFISDEVAVATKGYAALMLLFIVLKWYYYNLPRIYQTNFGSVVA